MEHHNLKLESQGEHVVDDVCNAVTLQLDLQEVSKFDEQKFVGQGKGGSV